MVCLLDSTFPLKFLLQRTLRVGTVTKGKIYFAPQYSFETRKQYPIAFNRKSAALKSPLSAKINKRRRRSFEKYITLQMFLAFFAICDFFAIWCACAALIFVRLILRAALFRLYTV